MAAASSAPRRAPAGGESRLVAAGCRLVLAGSMGDLRRFLERPSVVAAPFTGLLGTVHSSSASRSPGSCIRTIPR